LPRKQTNTNMMAAEMRPYVQAAVARGYAVRMAEPTTPLWRKFKEGLDEEGKRQLAEELAEKNVHGVPPEVIKQMLDSYQASPSAKEIMDAEDKLALWIRTNCRFAKRPSVVLHPGETEEQKQESAEHYFALGHGEESEGFIESDPSTHQVWVLVDGEIESAPTDEFDRPQTHGTLWGHDLANETWKGRYEGDTGRLSVVPPERIMSVPQWMRDKLIQHFNYVTEINVY